MDQKEELMAKRRDFGADRMRPLKINRAPIAGQLSYGPSQLNYRKEACGCSGRNIVCLCERGRQFWSKQGAFKRKPRGVWNTLNFDFQRQMNVVLLCGMVFV
ncbi:hypothetical protein ElyMa_004283400 [Elysia marginata]|uniref:Uncharacterized protein n=1 Tax=Elysia marginata TaxID=1093978 RepID=A0AAV4GZ22_9GAST|nr:hypothetical protein ElyMa_004283400 [Elysia marginata]